MNVCHHRARIEFLSQMYADKSEERYAQMGMPCSVAAAV
jgi:hypothetical protein